MQAIILAGGFGSRLAPALSGVPKSMAPVSGKPFLCWLLEYMDRQGVRDVALCVHYMQDYIQESLGDEFGAIRLHYMVEETPLGTGGALKRALHTLSPKQPVFALNGDSMVSLNYRRMMDAHVASGRALSMAVTHVEDGSRYSELTIENDRITRFDLFGKPQNAAISAGFYVMSPELFDGFALPDAFSFERDFLAPHVPQLQPAAYRNVHYFIDIGVPEDYSQAQIEIPGLPGVGA